MNILPFLHFFAFLVYLYLIIVILIQDSKSWLNRSCAAFLACLSLWSFTYIFIHNINILKDTAMLFDNISSIGWASFPSFFLWFSLIFIEKKEILKIKIIYPLIFISPLLFIYKQWAGFLTVDYIKKSWGWKIVWSDSIWLYSYYLYYLLFMGIGLYLILNFGRKTKEPIKKKQARIIFIATLIPFILGTLTDMILPELLIYNIPLLGDLTTIIWALGIVYAIAKYKLMVITPAAAADNIISTIADSLILLERKGNIAAVNKATLDLSGYRKSELEGKPIEKLFREKDFTSTLLDRAIEKEAIRNYELNLKTKRRGDIPVLFSSSTMMDGAGGMAGIVCIIKDITKRKQTEEALKESEQRFRDVTENILEWVWEVDTNGKYVYSNPICEKILGYKPEELLKKHFYDLFVPEEQEQLKKTAFEAFANKQPFREFINLNIHKDGKLVWMSTSGVPILDKKGNLLGYRGVDMDITQRKLAEEAIGKSQQEFASLFKSNPEALVYLDEKAIILDANLRFCELFGYTLKEIKGKNLDDGMIHPSDKIEEGKKLSIKGLEGYLNYETIRKKKDGTLFPVSISATPLEIDGQVKGEIATYIDITERKQLEEKLEKLARIDSLTGCNNRGYSLEMLDGQVNLSHRSKSPLLLAFLDIDGFKAINDTFGHVEGDKVLIQATKLFKSTFRKIDIICRFGGDEFLLIFPESSLNDAPQIIERLNKNLKKLNQKLAKPYKIDFSIGLSCYDPDNPQTMDELIRIADEKMYEEKRRKK